MTLDDELLCIIASQAKLTPYSIVMSMSVVAYMMYLHLPDQVLIWGGWMAIVVLSQLYRLYRLPKLPRLTEIPARRRTREAATINVVCTLILSLSLLAFPMFSPFQAAVQTITFVGFGVGSIVTAVGWAPYALSHIGLTLMPMFGLWAWSGFFGSGGILALLIALVGAAYSLTVWFIGKRLFEMNRIFFVNRAALRVALAEAESAAQAKTRFLAAASHDLRQPIHTLSLFSGALTMIRLDASTRNISDNIRAAVVALSAQLDSMLDMSKLDAGIVPVSVSSTDLAELVRRLSDECEAAARANNISIQVLCPPRAMASTDPALLSRVLRNVLINAITHNSDCEISLRVVLKKDHWSLIVADTGAGIAFGQQQHIFEEFYQVEEPGGERSKGLGLGLAIVKRLAALLELDMQFKSQAGVGTSFQFTVPLDLCPEQVPQSSEAAVGPLFNVRVLVVDDERSVQEGMKVLLTMLGCKVDLADSMEEAIRTATLARPDLALVDYSLRGAHNGLQTIEELGNLYEGLPAILISGDTGPGRLREARAAKVPLLSKPVASDSLYHAIIVALEES